MKKRLEMKDGSSSKFWQIEVAGTSFTTTYGKIGAAGQSTTKSFSSPAECEAEANKLLKEKLKKGYLEVGASDAAAPTPAAASGAPDFKQEIAYLVDTPGAEALVDAIAARVTGGERNGDAIVFHFDDGKKKMFMSAPAAHPSKKHPPEFQAFEQKHANVMFPDDSGWCLILGNNGGIDFDIEDADVKVVREALTDYSDWWIYLDDDNAHGKPALAQVSHESASLAEQTDLNAGSLFLSRVASILELKVELPAPPGPASAGGALTPRAAPEKLAGIPGERGLTFLPIDGDDDHFLAAAFADDDHGALALFTADDAPRVVGTARFPGPLASVHGQPKAQKIGDELLLGDSRGYLHFHLPSLELKHALRSDAMRASHVFSLEEMAFHYYLNDTDANGYRERNGASVTEAMAFPHGDGTWRMPIGGAPSSITLVASHGSYAHDTLALGDRALLITQKGIELYDAKKHASSASVRINLYWPRLASLGKHPRCAVMETSDLSGFAVRLIEIEAKKLKAGAKLFKKHEAKAWCVDGDQLFVVLHSERKGEDVYALGVVDVAKSVEAGLLPLSPDVSWRDACWMRVRGNDVTILLDDGTLHRLTRA